MPQDVRAIRVVVAIDPAVTNNKDSDETGIVVAALGSDGHGYVLEDLSGRYGPDAWARKAVDAYHRWQADLIIGEVNNGGDMIGHTVKVITADVAYRSTRATRGKVLRAEPIATAYEQGRVHHVGTFDALEQQMAQCRPGEEQEHDDRLDAMVWALTELGLVGAGMSWGDVYEVGGAESPSNVPEVNPWAEAYQ
jgi:predicted phage terminase large subunit-like protein